MVYCFVFLGVGNTYVVTDNCLRVWFPWIRFMTAEKLGLFMFAVGSCKTKRKWATIRVIRVVGWVMRWMMAERCVEGCVHYTVSTPTVTPTEAAGYQS